MPPAEARDPPHGTATIVRWSLVALGLLHALHVVAVVQRGLPRSPFYHTLSVAPLLLFLAGLLAVVAGLVVASRREPASSWAGAGVAAALLLGLLSALLHSMESILEGFGGAILPVTFVHGLRWAGFVVPPFLALSLEDAPRRPILLQGLGAATVLLAALPFLLADLAIQGGFFHALPLDRFRWLGGTLPYIVPQVLGELALVAGIAWSAVRVDARWRFDLAAWWHPVDAKPVLAVGAFLLALTWVWGGNLLVVPFWPVPLLVLAAPLLHRALSPPFEVDAPRIALAVLLLVGLVPVGSGGACTAHHWTDTGDTHTATTTVHILELAGHGPRWASGGGFEVTEVDCAPWLDALALLWVAGLAGASWWAGERSRDADPAPPSLT